MDDSKFKWGTIALDSLKIIILGIIYLIICINCIVLVKFFPHYRSEDNLREAQKPVSGSSNVNIYQNQTILDSLFPTDLSLPPYSSAASAITQSEITTDVANPADINFNGNNLAKQQQAALAEAHVDPLYGKGDCAYQESQEKWAKEVHKFIFGPNGKLEENKFVEWPYNWLKNYESEENSSWATWYFRYKIANMILNQKFMSRSLMKGLLGQKWWGFIPDWLLFFAIPLGSNVVTSLVPLLPTLIGFYLFYVIGIVLIVVTVMTYLWIWFPPSAHKFDCYNKGGVPINFKNDKLRKLAEKLTDGCRPTILGQLLMFVLMFFTGWLFSKSLSWWKNGIKIDPKGFFAWFLEIIKELGDFALLLLVVVSFAIFMWSGGFLIIVGSASMVFVMFETLFKLFVPAFLYPSGLFNIFYCNRDIITILLTALVTANIQQNKLLPKSVTGTMWGVWGIMLILKIFSSSTKIFSNLK